MFKTIGLIVAAAIAVVLIYAATRPDTFRVERTASIKAPPEKVFPLIADFHNWGQWSPWEKLDPAMKRTLSGATSGKGAAYAWDGNSDVGAGRMEITDATAPTQLAIQLDFARPFEGHSVAEFMLQAQGDATKVTWAMRGPSPYLAKVMGIFCNMDKMIGKDFETGLANMKAVAEK